MRVWDRGVVQNQELRNSLNVIKGVQDKLEYLSGTCTTPIAIAYKIELFNVLLCQISDIRSSLAWHMRDARESEAKAFVDLGPTGPQVSQAGVSSDPRAYGRS